MNNNTCVCCGAIIPEGRQVCPNCESGKYNSDEFFSAERKRTNGERIRAMTDEELANFIEELPICPKDFSFEKCKPKCVSCWLDWLKSSENVSYR